MSTSAVRWSSPELRQVSLNTIRRGEAGLACCSSLAEMASRDPEIFIGAELKIGLMMLSDNRFSELSDNVFWREKIKVLFTRPAIEPLCLGLYRLDTDNLTIGSSLMSVLSISSGKKVSLRQNAMFGIAKNDTVKFENLAKSREWGNDIRKAARLLPAYLLPHFCFARMLFAHPFDDGNGRAARILMNVFISRIFGSNISILPISPFHYLFSTRISALLSNLVKTGDWNFYFDGMTEFIVDCSSLTFDLYSKKTR